MLQFRDSGLFFGFVVYVGEGKDIGRQRY